MNQSRIVAIDANNILHRLYHAMGAQAALKQWSVHLGALAHLCGVDNSALHIAFDGPRGTAWRRELVPEYKAGRSEKHDDMVELLQAATVEAITLECEVYELPDAEADDIIAAIVTRYSNNQVLIVSSDADLFQLLQAGRVTQLVKYSTRQGVINERQFRTAESFIAQYGIQPSQWPAWKALAGDKTDNIAGVPWCGPETAYAILGKFPTLVEATADRWQLPVGARQRNAIMHAKQSGLLERLQRICTLRRDCLDKIYAEGGTC